MQMPASLQSFVTSLNDLAQAVKDARANGSNAWQDLPDIVKLLKDVNSIKDGLPDLADDLKAAVQNPQELAQFVGNVAKGVLALVEASL